MVKAVSKVSGLWMYVLVAAGLLVSCTNNDPVQQQSAAAEQGFPQKSSSGAVAPGNDHSAEAAKAATPGVVHIKTSYSGSHHAEGLLGDLYGRDDAPAAGSGSGVVISSDGYIATNNHVIENAEKVEVVFPDRRLFTAKVVGTDPNTDLALLKVDAKDLPYVMLGNSDDVQVGDWVLAVGYPYSLNTTVTAGIVSAKGRSIGIINGSSSRGSGEQTSSAVESFIQTDAAINPGNSGGALVNMNGELIGINTAIASLTGSYAGYAFAVPVNLAKKVLDDMKAFGKVKRGLLGVSFPSPQVEDEYLKQQGIAPGSVKGILITEVQKGSAADGAGLRQGDIIQRLDSVELSSSAEFSERIARHRPGDKIKIDFIRNGKEQSTAATLKEEVVQLAAADNKESLTDIYTQLGATFAPLDDQLKKRFGIHAGVVVTRILRGGFFNQLGVPPGTIIVYINGKPVNSPQDIDTALKAAKASRLQILGIAPDGSRIAFNFSLGT